MSKFAPFELCFFSQERAKEYKRQLRQSATQQKSSDALLSEGKLSLLLQVTYLPFKQAHVYYIHFYVPTSVS